MDYQKNKNKQLKYGGYQILGINDIVEKEEAQAIGVQNILANKRAHGLAEELYTPAFQKKEREEEFWNLIKQLKEETKFGDKVVAEKYKVKDNFEKLINSEKCNLDNKYKYRGLQQVETDIVNLGEYLKHLKSHKGLVEEKQQSLKARSGVFKEWLDEIDTLQRKQTFGLMADKKMFSKKASIADDDHKSNRK